MYTYQIGIVTIINHAFFQYIATEFQLFEASTLVSSEDDDPPSELSFYKKDWKNSNQASLSTSCTSNNKRSKTEDDTEDGDDTLESIY